MTHSPQLLLISSIDSRSYYPLNFAKEEICMLFKRNKTFQATFIPYGRNDFDKYTWEMTNILNQWGISVKGIHTYPDPVKAIESAEVLLMGGGNAFLLLKRLYEYDLVKLIRKRVIQFNLPYIGIGSGTTVASAGIHTTNDMPITYPPSLHALNIIPCNLNPHYIDGPYIEYYKGETQDDKIYKFLEMSYSNPVLGLKKGCILKLYDDKLTICGHSDAVMLDVKNERKKFVVNEDVSFLLQVYI